MNIEGLRTKLAEVAPLEEEKNEVESRPPRNPQTQVTTLMSSPEVAEVQGWTPVAPGKVARRHHNKATKSMSQYTGQSGVGMVVKDIKD